MFVAFEPLKSSKSHGFTSGNESPRRVLLNTVVTTRISLSLKNEDIMAALEKFRGLFEG